MWLVRWRWLVVAIVGLVSMSPARADGESSWGLLGPTGPSMVQSIAVAPTWPSVALILVSRADGLVQSTDSGRTWKRLAQPPEPLDELLVLDAAGGDRVAFGLNATGGVEWRRALYRSADDGGTWKRVVTAPGSLQLRFSPGFGDDGVAFAVGGGIAYRTMDHGASWTQIDPASGQRVQDVMISPDFVRDRTIYVAATSGDFPSVLEDKPASQPSTDHEDSLGVMMSSDGGDTWVVVSAGLEADGQAYRHIRSLAISPTFASDGTMFAFAWGPRVPADFGGGLIRTGKQALFRSRDRGQSWSPVALSGTGQRVDVTMSPTFASDGIVLAAASASFLTPASSSCTVHRSANGGDTWVRVIEPHSYESCSELTLLRHGDVLTGLVQKGFPQWLRSVDGGTSWHYFAPAVSDSPSPTVAITASPSFSRDGLLFVGGEIGGVWAFGSGAESTDGSLPCPSVAVGGFGRAIAADLKTRAWLGCALEPERQVAIHERLLDRTRAVRLADDPSEWFELETEQPDGWSPWSRRVSAERPFPTGPESPFDGAVQRFDGGMTLFMPRPDGRRTILVLAQSPSSREWHETPD